MILIKADDGRLSYGGTDETPNSHPVNAVAALRRDQSEPPEGQLVMLDASKSQFAEEGADITLPQGEHCQIRPMHAGDEPMLREMFAHCCASDVYLRCFAAIKNFPEVMAARLARMNPAEEIALVATPPHGEPESILGVAHVILEHADDLTAEFDVMVRTDQKGHGLGYALMTALLHEAEIRGFEAVIGYILQENRTMLQMTGELGFKVERIVGGVAEVRVKFATAA